MPRAMAKRMTTTPAQIKAWGALSSVICSWSTVVPISCAASFLTGGGQVKHGADRGRIDDGINDVLDQDGHHELRAGGQE